MRFSLTLMTVALAPAIAWFYGDPWLVWITVETASKEEGTCPP